MLFACRYNLTVFTFVITSCGKYLLLRYHFHGDSVLR